MRFSAARTEPLTNLPLDGRTDRDAAKATGADGRADASLLLPPMLPLDPDNRGNLLSIPDNSTDESEPAKKRENPRLMPENAGFLRSFASGRHGIRTCDLRRVSSHPQHPRFGLFP